jgi:hypothetical protein
MPVHVRLVLTGVGERNLIIRLNQDERFERCIKGERNEVNLWLRLKPGINRIDMESREPAVRVSNEPGHLRAFALHETSVRAPRGSGASD